MEANIKQRSSINTGLSDLFFNTDHSDAWRERKGGGEYDRGAMLVGASQFLASLALLGVDKPCSPEALVEDFFERL